MPYRLVRPHCEMCGKPLTPALAIIKLDYGRLRKSSEYCCNQKKNPHLSEYDSVANILQDIMFHTNQVLPKEKVITFSTKVEYALERIVADSWIALFIHGGLISNKYKHVHFSVNDDGEANLLLTDTLDQVKRITGRPVRLMKRILTPELAEHMIDLDSEIFHNSFTAAVNSAQFNWSLVKGNAIKEWYLERVYADNCGTLSSSCMRHTSCQPYLDIYTKNDKQVELLIAVSSSDLKLHGRALVWTMKNGKKYLSRPYGNDVMQKQMTLYAKRKGWEVFPHLPSANVQLDHIEFDEYPYVDVFSYLNKEAKEIRHEDNAEEEDFELFSTSGELEEYDHHNYYYDD